HLRHAHQRRLAVDLCRAGAALACLAIPSNSEVVGLGGLHLMNRIEDDHARSDRRLVIFELAAQGITAPDAQRCRLWCTVRRRHGKRSCHRYVSYTPLSLWERGW